jgi:hypothetical protein
MDTAVYTTKQVAESLNKTVNQIHTIKNKYKHLLNADHCILTRVDVNNILLWSGLGLNKLKELFSQEEEIMAARKWTESQKQRQRELIESWKPSQNTKGPTTEQGKAISKMNALKHGKYSAAQRLKDNSIKAKINSEIFELESKIAELKRGIEPEIFELESKILSLKKGIESEVFELKSRIIDLKNSRKQINALVYQGVPRYEKKWVDARTEYESGGVTLSQLAHKLGVSSKTVERRSKRESWCKNKESQLEIKSIQLTMATDEDEVSTNPNETIYDRMRAFAIENGIEIKTMQTA